MDKKSNNLFVFLLLFIIILTLTLSNIFLYSKLLKSEEKYQDLNTQLKELENTISNNKTNNNNNNPQDTNFHDYTQDTFVLEDAVSEPIYPANTLKYSIYREFSKTKGEIDFYNLLNTYCSSLTPEGDSASWEILESNYSNETPTKIGKYFSPINFSITAVNELVAQDPKFDNLSSIEDTSKLMWNIIKDNNLYSHVKFNITGLSIMNGNNSSKEDYYNNSRAKKIQVTFNNNETYTYNLEDTNIPQLIDLDYTHQDLSKPIYMDIEVIETYPGTTSDDIYINEIGIGFNSLGLGAR